MTRSSYAALAVLLTGCPSGTNDSNNATPSADFASVKAILSTQCAGCHVGVQSPSGNLALDPAVAFCNTVGKFAGESPTKKYIDPGHPESSYLLARLKGADGSNAQMPLGKPALAAEQIATIDAWIAAGALPSSDSEKNCISTDTTAPTFAGLKSVAAKGETKAELKWEAASDDKSAAAAIHYRIYVGATAGAENFTTPALTTDAGATSAEMTITSAVAAFFVVRAVDEAGNEDKNSVELSMTSKDQTPPTFKGLVSLTLNSDDSVTASWDPATDNVDGADKIAYAIYTGTEPGSEDFKQPVDEVQGATTRQSATLPEGQTVYVVVRARDRAGNEEANTAEKSVIIPDVTPPIFDGATSAVAATGSVTVSWSDAIDNVSDSSAIKYAVYQTTEAGKENFKNPTTIANAGQTSFIASGLAANTKYYFVVRARDAAGNEEDNKVEVSATTPSTSDTTAPVFSGATSASPLSPTSIQIGWEAATDDVTAQNQIVYLVYVATATAAQNFGTASASSNPGATSVTLTGLVPSTKYFVVVHAQDAAGNINANPKEVSATTPDDTTPAAVTVSPNTLSVKIGENVTLAATITNAEGATLLTATANWSTDNAAIASIDSQTGKVTGVAVGSANIKATSGGKSSTPVPVTVTTNVSKVTISPTSIAALNVGATSALTATVTDASGATLTGKTVSWDTASHAIATISSAGVLTGVAAGGTTVKATVEGVASDAAAVTITANTSGVSFKNDVTPIFGTSIAHCNNCHNWTRSNVMPWVVAGDSAASTFYKKVSGVASAGKSMPQDVSQPLSTLDSAAAQKIKDWIDQGALDN